MALIKPGIHENLVLTDKSKINEHGTLELGIKVNESGGNALLDAFENDSTFEAMESTFRLYPPNLLDFDKNPKTSAEIAAEVLIMRKQLMEYAMLYGSKEEVSGAFGGMKMLENLGIPPENYAQALDNFNKEDFLKKVITNLCTKFLNYLQSKNAFANPIPFRQKFLRQSQAKNFAIIPNTTYTGVWIEPMTVPADQSKVAFTEYEISKGKHNPDPVASSGAQSTEQDVAKADELFSADANTSSDNSAPDLFQS